MSSSPQNLSDDTMMGDNDDLHKSFQQLRRLMGMELPEEEIMETTEEGNVEVSFATTARPSVTFTSLRKLVDERASFCMPSTRKKNTAKKPRAAIPRGVYDDSDREEDDDLLFVDNNSLPNSPSLFQGVATPPISPILKAPDSDVKPSQQISRSILPELEATESSKADFVKIDTVESEEDEDGDDSQVQELAPPATPIYKQKKSRGSLRTVLYVLVAMFLLMTGGFFGRLYQQNKLDHFVAQVKDGSMDTVEFKTAMIEVTGTQDIDFQQHYADMEHTVKRSYSSFQTKLQQSADGTKLQMQAWHQQTLEKANAVQTKLQQSTDDTKLQMQVWHQQALEKASTYQGKLGAAWEDMTVKNLIGEENLNELIRRHGEMKLALLQAQSDLAAYADQGRMSMYSKFEHAGGPAKVALMKQKILDLQNTVAMHYEKSAIKTYLQSLNIPATDESVTESCSSAPVMIEEEITVEEAISVEVETEGDTFMTEDESLVNEELKKEDDVVIVEVVEETVDVVLNVSEKTSEGEDIIEEQSIDDELSGDVRETPAVETEDSFEIQVESGTGTVEEESADETVEEEMIDDREASIAEPEDTVMDSVDSDGEGVDGGEAKYGTESIVEDIESVVEEEAYDAEFKAPENADTAEQDEVAEEFSKDDVAEVPETKVEMEPESEIQAEEIEIDETSDDTEPVAPAEADIDEQESMAEDFENEDAAEISETSTGESESIDISDRAVKTKPKPLRKIRNALGNIFGRTSEKDLHEEELQKMKAELDGMLQNIPKSDTVVSDEEILGMMQEEDLIREDPKRKVKAAFGKMIRRRKVEPAEVAAAETN